MIYKRSFYYSMTVGIFIGVIVNAILYRNPMHCIVGAGMGIVLMLAIMLFAEMTGGIERER